MTKFGPNQNVIRTSLGNNQSLSGAVGSVVKEGSVVSGECIRFPEVLGIGLQYLICKDFIYVFKYMVIL